MHVASSSLFARSLHDALPIFIKVRLHAFFSLIVVAVATGLAAGIGVGDVIDVVIDGFSDTVGTVALLVGFGDRKSTRLNSSHVAISYAVFCSNIKSNHLRSLI